MFLHHINVYVQSNKIKIAKKKKKKWENLGSLGIMCSLNV